MPVEEQAAVALYQFGHYSNASSTMKVALWAGVSYGTVRNITIRVMTALCVLISDLSALSGSYGLRDYGP
jgi:hypothetical protein